MANPDAVEPNALSGDLLAKAPSFPPVAGDLVASCEGGSTPTAAELGGLTQPPELPGTLVEDRKDAVEGNSKTYDGQQWPKVNSPTLYPSLTTLKLPVETVIGLEASEPRSSHEGRLGASVRPSSADANAAMSSITVPPPTPGVLLPAAMLAQVPPGLAG